VYACVYIPNATDEQRARLRKCAESFSPCLEEPAPGQLLFDLRGLARLFGTPHQIADAIRRQLQPEARVAVAANPTAATAAVRGLPGVTVIMPGKERERLGLLPVELLDPSEELAETLSTWGIHTFEEFAALPERGVAERLGAEGLKIYRRALGLAIRPLVPEVELLTFEGTLTLEHPLELLEPLSFLLSRLLNDVCSKLSSNGYATNEIQVTLSLEGGLEHARCIRLPYAGRDPASFLKLVQFDLAAHPPDAPIVGVAVKVKPVEPRRVQTGLFLPPAPESEKLELTLAKLAAVVGEGNVGAAELPDTHRPGAFRMVKFAARPQVQPAMNAPEPHLALRLFRPPLAASVVVEDGRPRQIAARGIRGEVTGWAGPWRTSGEWWRADPWARDEWDVSLRNGELYRLYRNQEPQSGEWFIEGNYD
jgi:protein ImuB